MGRTSPMPAEAALPPWADRAPEMLRQTHWSAAQLSVLGLALLPGTERRIRDWLKERSCTFRRTRLPGGGVALRWDRLSFPRRLCEAIAARLQAVMQAAGTSTAAPAEDPTARSQQRLRTMPPRMQARADARAELLDAWRDWRAATGRYGWRGQNDFCAAYNAGKIAVSAATRAAIGHVCAASISNWQKGRAAHGVAGLAGGYDFQKGTIDSEPELVATAEEAIRLFPHIRAARLHEVLQQACPELDIPSVRGVQRWFVAWKSRNRRLHAHLMNPDDARSRFGVAFGTAHGGTRAANDLWEADATPADIILADGRRQALIGVIDVATRRFRLMLVPTSSGIGIALLLRRCLLEWGVPREFLTDNGADFTSRHVTRVLRDLGIAQRLAPPFTPQAKPHIERAFRTFAHDLLELMPGFGERQAVHHHQVGDELRVAAVAAEERRFLRRQRHLRADQVEDLLGLDHPLRALDPLAFVALLRHLQAALGRDVDQVLGAPGVGLGAGRRHRRIVGACGAAGFVERRRRVRLGRGRERHHVGRAGDVGGEDFRRQRVAADPALAGARDRLLACPQLGRRLALRGLRQRLARNPGPQRVLGNADEPAVAVEHEEAPGIGGIGAAFHGLADPPAQHGCGEQPGIGADALLADHPQPVLAGDRRQQHVERPFVGDLADQGSIFAGLQEWRGAKAAVQPVLVAPAAPVVGEILERLGRRQHFDGGTLRHQPPRETGAGAQRLALGHVVADEASRDFTSMIIEAAPAASPPESQE